MTKHKASGSPFLPAHPFPCPVEDDFSSMIRVNLAGEQSAVTIYEGQMRALGDDAIAPVIEEMKVHEEEHEALFLALVRQHHVRPSLFGVLWRWAGYGLGWVAGKLGPSYAMAQTEAVETVIEQHYQEQIDHVPPGDFRTTLKKCQEDEHHHKAVGAQTRNRSLSLDGWMLLTRLGTRLAVRIAKRI
ncbi:demethoxyubiquinone hydroxylase family protein [Candidatus Hepatobacter penaei]|uniref:demethoxyubiquinone hydroxylase family protein n=1 Tax=Candidatus Hepatobacter penaei TaxID=1274402 RepID=UPI000695CF66|nr:demethoxyubiquinone hydroxylase family protein [Candidatus Hepatobacter penaei]